MRLFAVILVAASVALLNAAEPHYVGANKCAKMCHKSDAKGAQLKKWQESAHAKAYKTLASPESKEIAEKAGVEGDPQKAEACLKCHVTAFGVKAELIDSTFNVEDGVQCEACHGPGSNYQKLKVMKDKKLALAAGLVEPTEEVCTACHNKQSPTFKPFDYAEMAKQIAHSKPAPAK
jgi:hypothetical protein